MTIETKIKSHPNVVTCFKELPFYNKRIKKPKLWFAFWASFLWRAESDTFFWTTFLWKTKISTVRINCCIIITILKKVKSHPKIVEYFKDLPLYNKFTEKPKIKRLKNLDLLSELPFYEELNIIKQIMRLEDTQWVTKLK